MSTATTSPLMIHDRADEAFVAQYARDGFAILRGALTPTEVDAVNAEALRICRAGLNPVDSGIDAHEGESDADVLRQYLCIHHPHKISTAASEVMHHPTIVDALTKVIGPDVVFGAEWAPPRTVVSIRPMGYSTSAVSIRPMGYSTSGSVSGGLA